MSAISEICNQWVRVIRERVEQQHREVDEWVQDHQPQEELEGGQSRFITRVSPPFESTEFPVDELVKKLGEQGTSSGMTKEDVEKVIKDVLESQKDPWSEAFIEKLIPQLEEKLLKQPSAEGKVSETKLSEEELGKAAEEIQVSLRERVLRDFSLGDGKIQWVKEEEKEEPPQGSLSAVVKDLHSQISAGVSAEPFKLEGEMKWDPENLRETVEALQSKIALPEFKLEGEMKWDAENLAQITTALQAQIVLDDPTVLDVLNRIQQQILGSPLPELNEEQKQQLRDHIVAFLRLQLGVIQIPFNPQAQHVEVQPMTDDEKRVISARIAEQVTREKIPLKPTASNIDIQPMTDPEKALVAQGIQNLVGTLPVTIRMPTIENLKEIRQAIVLRILEPLALSPQQLEAMKQGLGEQLAGLGIVTEFLKAIGAEISKQLQTNKTDIQALQTKLIPTENVEDRPVNLTQILSSVMRIESLLEKKKEEEKSEDVDKLKRELRECQQLNAQMKLEFQHASQAWEQQKSQLIAAQEKQLNAWNQEKSQLIRQMNAKDQQIAELLQQLEREKTGMEMDIEAKYRALDQKVRIEWPTKLTRFLTTFNVDAIRDFPEALQNVLLETTSALIQKLHENIIPPEVMGLNHASKYQRLFPRLINMKLKCLDNEVKIAEYSRQQSREQFVQIYPHTWVPESQQQQALSNIENAKSELGRIPAVWSEYLQNNDEVLRQLPVENIRNLIWNYWKQNTVALKAQYNLEGTKELSSQADLAVDVNGHVIVYSQLNAPHIIELLHVLRGIHTEWANNFIVIFSCSIDPGRVPQCQNWKELQFNEQKPWFLAILDLIKLHNTLLQEDQEELSNYVINLQNDNLRQSISGGGNLYSQALQLLLNPQLF